MATNHKRATVLIGGGAGAVDKIDGAGLSAGDTIQCINLTGIYNYVNVQDSRAELEPFTIRPDTNPGTNSWHLVGTTAKIGALVELTSAQPISDSTLTPISWDAIIDDNASFWAGGNPTRLTIPIGVTSVKLTGNISWESDSVGRRVMYPEKNGSTFKGSFRVDIPASFNSGINGKTSEISVSATDYFELNVYQGSGGELDVADADETWFSIEATNFA